MESWSILFDLVVLLSGCLLFGGVFARFGQSPLVGYLFAGILLGGHPDYQIIHSENEIELLAELGVALLLFTLGLEFSWDRIRRFGGRAILVGTLQIVVTLAVAASATWLFGLGALEATAVGAMVCLSSTACVLRVFAELREIDSLHGRHAVTILLLQDIAVVPLVILMSVLNGEGQPFEIVISIAQTALAALLLIGSLYLVLNKLAVLALGQLTLERNRELTVLLAITTGLGSTWASHAAGFSPALGAFVAGMFLGSSVFATQIRADISSLKTLLLTLFFGAAGMVADPIWIAQNLPAVLTATFLLLFGKTLVIFIIMSAVGMSYATALATGISLAQVGEFAFVLGSIGQQSGAISEYVYLLTISVTILSLFITPYAIKFAPVAGNVVERLFGRNRTQSMEVEAEGVAPADIILIGFGPTGMAIGEALVNSDLNVLVLDLNQVLVEKAKQIGLRGVVGDALQLDVLEHLNIPTARFVVITIPARAAAMAVLQHVRRLAPNTVVIVRSRYQADSEDFAKAGASAVVGDEEEVGQKLSETVVSLLVK